MKRGEQGVRTPRWPPTQINLIERNFCNGSTGSQASADFLTSVLASFDLLCITLVHLRRTRTLSLHVHRNGGDQQNTNDCL